MTHVSAAAPRSPFWVQGEAQQQRGGCRVLSSLLPWSSPGDVGTASGCLRVCWVRFGAVLAASLASCCRPEGST